MNGSAAADFLIAVFMFTGWDGAIYVNEETTRRHTNPGKAVMIAVALLAVIYTLATVGLVHPRHRGRRPDPDGRGPLRAPLPVLRDPAREQ
jgi:amino acid transporter